MDKPKIIKGQVWRARNDMHVEITKVYIDRDGFPIEGFCEVTGKTLQYTKTGATASYMPDGTQSGYDLIELVKASDGTEQPAAPETLQPTNAALLIDVEGERKDYPIATGCLDYFPDAIAALSHCSKVGQAQHGLEGPLQWDRSVSDGDDDSFMRHFLQRGTRDTDGVRHSVKALWRMMAIVQREIEADLGHNET